MPRESIARPVTFPVSHLRMPLAAAGLLIAALIASPVFSETDDDLIRAHGYSFYGDLSYPEGFEHFSYVNPDAPKGGSISISAQGTFDSMNPFTRRGRAGLLSSAIYESLLESSEPMGGGLVPADVYGEAYGLLAHTVEYPETKEWVIFHMRPEARFSDGTPLTAHDVVFSHNLFLEQGLPSYAQGVGARVLDAEALDDHTVKFTFADGISRRSLIDQVGGTPVFSQAWYEETGARLDESRMEISPGSGPYMLHGYEVNRRITYRRNPDYWANDLPQNRGRHNFDEIRIEYFADGAAAFEAFKTGEYTFRAENNSRQWATGYDFPALNRGHVVRDELPTGFPPTPTGFVFNLGRDFLQDKRVREAISLAFNFEWTNDTLQYGLFQQRASYSQGTRFQADGPPEGLELELLQSLGDLVPEEILTEPARSPHASDPARLTDRRNIRAAGALLAEAGWEVDDSGLLRNAAGERMTIEIPVSSAGSATMDSIIETFTQNLQGLGIDARFQRIDPAQHTDRRRNRDYDMIFDQYTAFMDTGTGLHQRFGSDAADDVFNPAGLRSELVDKVIDLSLDAPDPETRDAALMALDRVLRYEHFMIPGWYNDTVWIAHWDIFQRPEETPPFSTGEMDFWWFDAERAAELRAAGALR
ncbi:extracellular solute-binding protein [Roseinatronobacter monicus]|uniref:Microcin C transport system substrate-binding protein n=1 Tax=Roseinatronobacter monicus TaxID=393481 RepID=A0A543KGR2_9RHOB|nr:extracellular solute-binding protein [Roseinatronobacter monicus]TQM94265.1 microcin C transport system substrate-binding protein [Roseinatronobacter monicus]